MFRRLTRSALAPLRRLPARSARCPCSPRRASKRRDRRRRGLLPRPPLAGSARQAGLALQAAARPAVRPVAPAAPAAPKVAFEKYVLPNGLQVILHVDRKLPIVHVNQWYHVGSKNEKPGRTGFAHLFEHLMFQGSKNVPGEYFSLGREDGREPPRGRRQRHHQHRSHQLLRDRAVRQPRDAALGRDRPAGDAARRAPTRRSSTTSATWSRTSAGRASRTSRTDARTRSCHDEPRAGRASLLVAGHRQHGGSDAPRRSTT